MAKSARMHRMRDRPAMMAYPIGTSGQRILISDGACSTCWRSGNFARIY